MTAEIPSGVWAVANGIECHADLEQWMRAADWANVWTFRNPRMSERAIQSSLRCMKSRSPWLAVHRRLDWAINVEANAFIMGHSSLPWSRIRIQMESMREASGRELECPLLGASVHNRKEIDCAIDAGVDFLVYGPVWETPSKAGILKARGLAELSKACDVGLPLVAIGGINSRERIRTCLEVGAHATAVLRAFNRPEITPQQ